MAGVFSPGCSHPFNSFIQADYFFFNQLGVGLSNLGSVFMMAPERWRYRTYR